MKLSKLKLLSSTQTAKHPQTRAV